jgi:DNA-binding beta-propeller fold protein YncE
VGLEPVTVVARSDTQAWVVNHLSDSISIVDLTLGATIRTLAVGDEPTDVVFARGKAFVAVSREDAVKVFNLANLDLPPLKIDLFGNNARALALSPGGGKVYAVVLNSGNQTTVVNANVIAANNADLNQARLGQLGLNNIICKEPPARPTYPPLPPGIQRNPALNDPAPPAQPPVALIVRWDRAANKWKDEAGQDWTNCLPFRLPDHDLFVIDANTPGPPAFVDHLGTTLFDVSVNPASGRIYVPNTEARNTVRFEHPLGVRGHMVDNRLAVIDPNTSAVSLIDLNTHINRGSDPAANLPEREASVSQPGMMVWNSTGTRGYLTAIGSRKLFKVDGSCLSGACIFGADRAFPDAVEVGEGPTGVALHEGFNRLYVLNRFSNSIAVVADWPLAKIGEIPLHDPSSSIVRSGRRILYDGIESSGHGDAACSSCHIFGDRDQLVWDLGDPTGDFTPYGQPGDNVRVFPIDDLGLLAHAGFDPQKGPMTTQTLRGMLEPLHWRGDRPTLNNFNMAFVGLMGKEDIGPINGKPAGLDPNAMELFREFALDMRFPPNPYRRVDDTLPNQAVTIPGAPFPGNPAAGEVVFNTGATDAGQPCVSCHQHPFGASGGKLGGIQPGDPQEAKAALLNGDLDLSPHSDLKIPHLRNLYEKFGPRFGSLINSADPPADQKSGFGYVHDGSIPDLGTFLSINVFSVTAQQVRDLTSFLLHFPTGIKPAVGRHVTVPAGPPGDPSSAPEQLLSDLISLGNAADQNRHCELTISALGASPGARLRTYYLNGGRFTGGLWTTDLLGEPQVATLTLRAGAGGPLTFLCATIGSGIRLGADRDGDGSLNGNDCADGDAARTAGPTEVANVLAHDSGGSLLAWDDQSPAAGPSVSYEVVSGSLLGLRASGLQASALCLAGDLLMPEYNDARPGPAQGDGYYYMVRARSPECSGGFGPGAAAIEPLECSAP